MFCKKCGGQIPQGVKFCPVCGDEVKFAGAPKKPRQQESPTRFDVMEEFQKQMKISNTFIEFKKRVRISFLLYIACEGIMLLYAFLVPKDKLFWADDILSVFLTMDCILLLGTILFTVSAICAIKTYTAMLGQLGVRRNTDISSMQRAELEFGSKFVVFYIGIIIVLTLGAFLVVEIRFLMH